MKTDNKQQTLDNIARDICKGRGIDDVENCQNCTARAMCLYREIAESLYNDNYRKQSEGEWLVSGECTACNDYSHIRSKFCLNCGAKMKGGE